MTGAASPAPGRALSQHFFAALFRLTFLDDAGEESFRRALIGLLAASLAAGLFIGRLYLTKYTALHGDGTLAAMVAADRLFAVTLPMLATSLATTLVSRSIFPDELDYRILMALPLGRRTIFAAKARAVLRFAALFVGASIAALTLPLAVVTSGRLPGESRLAGIAAAVVGAAGACLFAVAAIAAVQGLVSIAAPRRRQLQAAIWLQTLTIAGLVLLVPFVLRSSALWRVLPARPPWLAAIPPAWFLSAGEWLTGIADPYFAGLGGAGALSIGVAFAAAAGCYLTAYQRFDQSIVRTATVHRPRAWRSAVPWPLASDPSRLAVRTFISLTIRRSGLHQFVFLGVFATGAALALNALLGSSGLSERWVVRAALGTPFTLMAGAVIGLRTALLLPTNLRAAWLFRLTEDAATRGRQIDAVRGALFTTGVVWPTALALPTLVLRIGADQAAAVAPMALLIGWAFTEGMSVGWRRVPFTCTFLFAKRPPAYTVAFLILVFGWFVFIGASLLDAARAGLVPWLIVAALVLPLGAALRWLRLQNWGRWPLEFEDYLPDGLDALRLNDL